jgi:L-lactate dehydrogenase complex protein LldF
VRINLHELLLHNRHEAVKQGESTLAERLSWKAWKAASLSRSVMNMGNGTLKNRVVNNLFTAWKKQHANLEFAPKTFNQMWKEQEDR